VCGLEYWSNSRFNNFQKYNLLSGTWSAIGLTGDLTDVKDSRLSFASINEHLYCLAGLKFFKLNTVTTTWMDSFTQSFATSVPSRRFAHGAVSLDKNLYIFGGFLDAYGSFQLVSDAFWGWNLDSRKWFNPVSSGAVPSTCGFPYMFTAMGNVYLVWGQLSYQGESLNQIYSSMNQNLYKWVPSTGVWSIVSTSGISPQPNQMYSSAASSNALLVVSGRDRRMYLLEFSSMTWRQYSSLTADATIFDGVSFPGLVVQALSAVSVETSFAIAVLTTDEREFLYHFNPTSNALRILSDSITNSSLPKFPKMYSSQTHYYMFYSNQKIYFFDNWPTDLIFPNSVERTFLANFDLATKLWTENFRNSVVGNSPPYNRDYQSITLIETRVFLFGGRACSINDGSGFGNNGCNDVYVLPFPKSVEWPRYRADWLNLFDWDILLVHGYGNCSIPENLPLCTVGLPCFVGVRGAQTMGWLKRSGNSGLVCVGSDGCIGISLENVIIECDGRVSQKNVVEFMDSSGFIANSSFVLCASKSDGGALQIRDNSNVTIVNSLFEDCFSEKSGGAVSVTGSTCYVSGSRFFNCTAMLNGGAFAAEQYFCYPILLYPTVHIENSIFENCGSIAGSGGCASIRSGSSNIAGSFFHLCSSEANGGGLFSSEGRMNLSNTQFQSCQSRRFGAAFSGEKLTVKVEEIKFLNNTALLGGGGAFFQDSLSTLKGTYGFGNTAITKGGGMVFWTGIEPRFLCGSGTWEDPASPGKCLACEAGKFSSVACGASLYCCECQERQYAAATGEIEFFKEYFEGFCTLKDFV
jgi:hypothetical protein